MSYIDEIAYNVIYSNHRTTWEEELSLMQEYWVRREREMKKYVQECEERFGMSSTEFISYYRSLESHGLEEEYDWYTCLAFLGQR